MKKIFTLGLLAIHLVSFSKIIYVDQSAVGTLQGNSWDDAFLTFAQAISAATTGDTIVVAKGIYLVDEASADVSLNLIGKVAIIGGFVGDEVINATSIANRDIKANTTILSGDINQDDNSGGNDSENSYYLFNVANMGVSDPSKTIIDGITFEAGRATNNPNSTMHDGAFMRLIPANATDSISFTIKNCVIRNNQGTSAIYNWTDGGYTNIRIENTRFENNGQRTIRNMVNGSSGTPGFGQIHVINCNFVKNEYCFQNNVQIGTFQTVIKVLVSNCIIWDNKQAVYLSSGGIKKVDFDHSIIQGTFLNTYMLDVSNNYFDIDPMFKDTVYYDTIYSASQAINTGDNSYGWGDNIGMYQGAGAYTNLSIDKSDNLSFENCPGTTFDTIKVSFIADDYNDVTFEAISNMPIIIDNSDISISGSGNSRSIVIQHDTLKASGNVIIKILATNSMLERDSVMANITIYDRPEITGFNITPTEDYGMSGTIEVLASGTEPLNYTRLDLGEYPNPYSYYSGLPEGEYIFYIKDGNGCKSEEKTAIVLKESDVVGIEKNSFNINVYPNPVNDIICISNLEDKDNVLLTNILGECLYSQLCPSNNLIFSVSDLPEGIYFLSVHRGRQTEVIKIIKQ